MSKGVHHIGLATHDMEKTLSFYESVLGFPAVVCEMIHPETGGAIRHAFLDTGNGELFAFMECNDVEGVQAALDVGINRGLGVRGGMVHFALRVDDEAELHTKREDLIAKGIEVSDVVDHSWCKSIYFRDPNFLQLEFCCLTEALGEEHVSARFGAAWRRWERK